MLFFLSIFSVAYCVDLLYTIDDGGYILQVDSTSGKILKKGIDSEHNDLPFTLKVDGSTCDLIAVGAKEVYHYDCDSLEQTHKYRLYDSKDLMDDVFYDNNHGVMYGIRQRIKYEKESPDDIGLELFSFDAPSGLRRHYRTKSMDVFTTDGNNPKYLHGCIDGKNQHLVMTDSHYSGDFNATNTYLTEFEWHGTNQGWNSGFAPQNMAGGFFGCAAGGEFGNDTLVFYSDQGSGSDSTGDLLEYDVYSGKRHVVVATSSGQAIVNGALKPDGTKYVGQSEAISNKWIVCDFNSGNRNKTGECKNVGYADQVYPNKMVWRG